MPDRATADSTSRGLPGASRMLAAATVALLVTATAVVVASPSAGASNGPCPDVNGVTVVVDFGALAGGVQVRCAPGDPDSGYAALVGAGFAVEGTLRSPGFLCRVDGQPTAAADPCVMPSPPWAYWSYWIADRGGPWCYADTGMYGRNPPRGTVEGWTFVSGSGAGSVRAPRSGTFSRLSGAGSTGADCDDDTTATTVPPTTAPRPPTTRPPAGGVGSPGGSPPGAPTTAAAVPGGPAAAPSPPPAQPGSSGAPSGSAGPAGAGAVTGVAGATTVAPSQTTTTSVAAAGEGTRGPGGASGDGEDPAAEPGEKGARGDGAEELSSSVALDDSGRSGPGSALGTGVGVGMIAALGAATVVVNRRRLQPPDGI